ncbi:hypothetical protein ACKUSY_00005, partial [Myroides odoratus]
ILWCIVIVAFLSSFSAFREAMDKHFFGKFVKKKSNLLDGRGETWNIIIDNMNFLGHDSYFMSSLPFAPHNTYLSILAQFGILFLMMFLALMIHILWTSYSFSKNDSSLYKYLPLIITINFLILSMTEGMLMKYTMLIVFLAYSCILNFKNKISSEKSITCNK